MISFLFALCIPTGLGVELFLDSKSPAHSCHGAHCDVETAVPYLGRSTAYSLMAFSKGPDSALLRVAILLPIVSSLDNFAVGASLGMSGHPLPVSANCIIALANAFGMMLSGCFGQFMGAQLGHLVMYFAGCMFVGIGLLELYGLQKEQESLAHRFAARAVESPWLISVPMTLNNLAGGVAGGLAGANVFILSISTLLASFIMMLMGHSLGLMLGTKLTRVNPQLFGAVGFVCLGLAELFSQRRG